MNNDATKVAVRHLSKRFRTREGMLTVLDDLSLEVRENEFVTVVGTSGCGKSTLLNIVGGLLRPSEGEVLVDGRPVTAPGRDRGMVFQGYSLFEWMNVWQNIAFALEKSGLPRGERRDLVAHYVEIIGLKGFEQALPKQLSGGMRQRVAIARALVFRPAVLLMDEPFGALDAQTRGMMQELLLDVWEKHRVTVIFVTHDVDEAIFLSDRVIVLASRPGRIKAEHGIELERPRPYEVMMSRDFAGYKRSVLEEIREETLKMMDLARDGR